MPTPISEDQRLALSQSAQALLFRFLSQEHRVPSRQLVDIFAAAGILSAFSADNELLITSESILFGILEATKRYQGRNEEESVLQRLALMLVNSDLSGQLSKYFQDRFAGSEKGPSSFTIWGITTSVERTLIEACERASATEPSDGQVISVHDFLWSFPVKGSVADSILQKLGFSKEEWRKALAGEDVEPAATSNLPISETSPAPLARPSLSSKKTSGKTRKRYNERVSTHTDEPAVADQLGRRNFAQVLSLRIEQSSSDGLGTNRKKSAFIVHLHGPWGSGKSSVLNFLQVELERSNPPWIVVNFNAWRDQRLQPPWWTLITTIYAQARSKLGWRAPLLWLRWQAWRFRADYLPVLSVIVIAGVLLTLVWLGFSTLQEQVVASKGQPNASWFESFLKLVPIGVTVLTILGAIYVGSRALALGSRQAAQAYADLKADPYKPIAGLFEKLVSAIDRPLAVFIDDLDRCDANYVVDLLEGIQTLMRGAAVTYVVAADRKWICSSFEQRYSGFSDSIGQPGCPLGYLFLDKVFQISAAIPQPSPEARSSYWQTLLNASPQALQRHEEELLNAEKQADSDASLLTRPEEMQALVRKAEKTGDIVALQATRAAVAKRVASQDAIAEAEHRLHSFAHLIDSNPRAMKRLVNAYALHQCTLFLSGSDTIFNTLARWTILELRWPLLADLLAVRPEFVDKLRSRLRERDVPQVPETLRRLFGDQMVIQVIGSARRRDRLSSATLRSILGTVQSDR